MDHLEKLGLPTDKGGVLQINGSPTDAAAGLIKDGTMKGSRLPAIRRWAEFDTPDWAPPKAQEWAAGQATRFDADIIGVVAAFKAAGVKPVPPVAGNDATIAALQLIIAGDKYCLISKPSEIVAAAAAQLAVAFLNGKTPEGRDEPVRHPLAAVHAGRRNP